MLSGFAGLTKGLKLVKRVTSVMKGVKGMEAVTQSVSKVVKPISGVTKGLGQVTGKLDGITQGIANLSQKNPPAKKEEKKSDNCKPLNMCFKGSKEQVSEKEQVWNSVKKDMRSETFSYGSKPAKVNVNNAPTFVTLPSFHHLQYCKVNSLCVAGRLWSGPASLGLRPCPSSTSWSPSTDCSTSLRPPTPAPSSCN